MTELPLFTILPTDPEFDEDVKVGNDVNKFVLFNRLVAVSVSEVVVVEPVNDVLAITNVNDVGGNTYDPLDPNHSFALLDVLLHTKYSPDAVLNQIAPFAVGLTVVSGLLAVI